MEANGDFGRCSLAKVGTRIIGNNLPKGLTDIKNAKGEVFKSVHTPPSTPHPRMDFHTHPNYRNVLPDRTKRGWPSLLTQTGPPSLNDIIFMQAIKCPWEQINDFRSLSEFKQFEKWMNEQIAADEAIEVPVINPYLGHYAGFDEKQYRHVASGKLWRLVWPESPFTGIFESVE